MGRPTKLTDSLTNQLVTIFRGGNVSIEDACAIVGIHPATYYRWMKDNDEFSEAIKKARALAVDGYLRVIRNAAEAGQWQAAAWWLERVRPDLFGRRQTVEVLTQDMVDREIARLRAQLADNDS